jgi:hypothetical protein
LRPTIPNVNNLPKIIVDLITSCWDKDPDARPDTEKILEILAKCKQEFEAAPELFNNASVLPKRLDSSMEFPEYSSDSSKKSSDKSLFSLEDN